MTGKINKKAGLVILITGLSIIAGGVGFAIWNASQQPQYFNPDKLSLGNNLYEDLLEYDLENSYPETPEEVMEVNNLLRRLMYGDIVIDDGLIHELVGFQRMLLDDELLAVNPWEAQTEKVLESAELLRKNNVSLFSATTGTVFMSDTGDECLAPLTESMVNLERTYWNYFLRTDDAGHWKIYNWRRMDRTFRTVIEDDAPEGLGLE